MNATATPGPPADAIAAVTHPDPYAYYAGLVAERPFYRDEGLRSWVASSARAVTAVLSNPACRVRPAAEPVPKAIAGSAAATIFRHLVRMNDGTMHPPLKQAVAATFDAVDAARLTRVSKRWAASLAREIAPGGESANLTAFAFGLTAHVLGSLLGVPDGQLPAVAQYVEDLARCFSPSCSPENVVRGNLAAARLFEQFLSQYRTATPAGSDTLFAELVRQGQRFNCDDPDVMVANGIGFLTQAYEGVTGLISTTLLMLARRDDVRELVAQTPGLLAVVVDEVLRYDSPGQNTRRYVAESTTIEGQELRPGEAVLVVLAAANRDPRANPDPDRFDVTRREARVFSFGLGPHACPGRRVATTIATAAVAQLLQDGGILERLELHPTYRPSANTRIPLLHCPSPAAHVARSIEEA
jgi:cytochrome P450